jgi:hypothetical protein
MKLIKITLLMLLLASCGRKKPFEFKATRFTTIDMDGRISNTYNNYPVTVYTDVYEKHGDTVIVMNSNGSGWILYNPTMAVQR